MLLHLLIAALPLSFLGSSVSQAASPIEIRVAAAADLKPVLDDLIQAYQAENPGQKVVSAIGSSGNFVNQIENGAPFDVFLSADAQYPKILEKKGHTEGKAVVYATGRIVLWVPKDSKLDLKQGLSVLESPEVHRIAIGNPAHAPYGRAAIEALKKAGLYERIDSKLVSGDNIAQAAQFAESGAADVGILALSFASAPEVRDRGRFERVDGALYKALPQTAVVIKSTKHPREAALFREFMKSDQAQAILARFGLGP